VTPLEPFESHFPDSTPHPVPAVSITPGDPATTDNLVVSITGSDLDDGAATYTYEWYKDDSTEPYVTTTTISTTNILDSKSTSKGQIWKCVVTVSDGSSDGTTISDDEVIIHNRPPSAPEIAISPGRPLGTNNLVCSIDNPSSDEDGDNIDYTYAWYNNGKLQSKLTTNTIDSSHTVKGEVWKCVVTASDSTANTTASDDVIIGDDVPNSPPTAPAIRVTPNFPNTSDDLVCTITTSSSDPDGDTISYSYRWYKDDVLQDGLTLNTIDSSLTSAGEVWKCMVAGSDGIDSSPGSFDEVTVVRKPTYYVDANSGDDDNDGTTIDEPFETLQQAARVVQPGDVVHIREGVYSANTTLRLTRSGTSDNPIVFEAYPGEEVILDGVMVYLDASWNILINLEIRNSPQQGIYVLGDHNVCQNIDTHHNYYSGIQVVGGNQNQFFCITSHHNYDPGNNGRHADGIGISSGTGNEFYQCVCWENSDDGFDTWQSSDTLLARCVSFRNGYDDGDGNGFKLGHNGQAIATKCIAFENGMNGGTSEPITGFTDNVEGEDIVVDHCTAFNNDDFDYENYQDSNIWTNNIGHHLQDWNSPGTDSHNSWNLGIDDPRYISTNPTSPDFLALRSDSPCRGAASDGSDIGALQYGERITDLIPDWLTISF